MGKIKKIRVILSQLIKLSVILIVVSLIIIHLSSDSTNYSYPIKNYTKGNNDYFLESIVAEQQIPNSISPQLDISQVTTTRTIKINIILKNFGPSFSIFKLYLYDENVLIDEVVIKTLTNDISYLFDNLKSDHYYKVIVENVNKPIFNLYKTNTIIYSTFIKTKSEIDTQIISNLSGYAISKNVNIIYNSGQIKNPIYMFNASGNIINNNIVYKCFDFTDIICNEKIDIGTRLEQNVWYKTTQETEIIFENNGTIKTRIYDGKTFYDMKSLTINNIDITAPTMADFIVLSKDKNSITVKAMGNDNESGIMRYQFSSDYGTIWTPAQESDEYTFNNLTHESYNIMVRVINGTYANNGQNSLNTMESDMKNIKIEN